MSNDEEAEPPMALQGTAAMHIPVNLPLPLPLVISGNLATNWKRFFRAWNNYEIASRLKDPSHPGLNKALRTATLLTCIGPDALDVFDGLDFENDGQKQDVDVVIAKFEKYCIGETNETYERYNFNKREQESNESVDAYLTVLRGLAKTCNFGNLQDNLIRDRIVMGVRDNSIRKKLLQESNLTLIRCVDICRAVEKTTRQMESMKGEVVMAVEKETPYYNRGSNPKYNEAPEGRLIKCKFCHKTHPRDKFKCPAWGKNCTLCKKPNHFAVACKSKAYPSKSSYKRKPVSIVDEDTDSSEEYVAMVITKEEVDSVESEQINNKPKAALLINHHLETFQLDSGSTVNVVSSTTLSQLFKKSVEKKMVKTKTTLVTYDGSEIKPIGKVRLQVINPKNRKKYSIEFMVVREGCKSIMGARASQQMQLLVVNTKNILLLNTRSKEVQSSTTPLTKEALAAEYPEVFEGEGTLPGILHLEIDETVPPVQLPTRRVPVAVKDKLRAELDRLVGLKILKPVDIPTDWISATVVTMKKSGGIRLCIDPKPLNKALKRNHYPLPTIDDILPDLSQARCFSVLDAKNGFWHVRLDEPSSMATTFGSPWGRYRWLRMPFGISPAPEEFQRRINTALEGLPGVKVIADDIRVLGCGKTDEKANQDHDTNLRELMVRCKAKGIKLNIDKIQLQLKEVSYMGHRITAEGLKIDPEKTRAIRDMPAPTDKQGVQRLLGMVNYVQKFAPKLAEITTPLRELIKKGNAFIWEEQRHGKALEKVKQMMVEPPVLCFFDPSVSSVLQCDASINGLGACLLQNDQPVAYASRSLTPTEVQYAQIEKEMLAIVFGMEKFEDYLYGRKVKVESDHKPLETILKKSLLSAPKRLQRMMLRLQKFDIDVVYKQGPLMYMADTLSRATTHKSGDNKQLEMAEVLSIQEARSEVESEVERINMLENLAVQDGTLNKIKQATKTDKTLQALVAVIKKGWPTKRSDISPVLHPYHPFRDEVVEQDGIIFKGERLVVPEKLRAEMKEKLHCNHGGIQATMRRAREVFYWPGMNRDIEEFVTKCSTCATYQSKNQKEPMMSHPIPSRPWQYLATDLFQLNGKDYLVTTDYYSSFMEVDRLYTKTSKEIIGKLKAHMARHGIPEKVVSDNGPQYSSEEFRNFAEKYEFDHRTSSPHYPQSNGKAESAVKTVKGILEKAMAAGVDPYLALLEQRNTPSDGMTSSPVQRLFGRRTRTRIPTSSQLLKPSNPKSVNQELKRAKSKQQYYYNKGAKKLSELKGGDNVRMMPNKGEKLWKKGKVEKVVSPRSYIVATSDGQRYRRNRRHLRSTAESEDEEIDIDIPLLQRTGTFGKGLTLSDSTNSGASPSQRDT